MIFVYLALQCSSLCLERLRMRRTKRGWSLSFSFPEFSFPFEMYSTMNHADSLLLLHTQRILVNTDVLRHRRHHWSFNRR